MAVLCDRVPVVEVERRSPAAPRLRFVDPLRDHLSHGVNIDLAGHAVDSALETVNHAGRGNDDGPSLDIERLLADPERRPALQHDEGLLIGMSMWLRALPSAATHDEEGNVRAVVTAHEDRGDRVVLDVFDTEDLQAPILTRGTMLRRPSPGIDDPRPVHRLRWVDAPGGDCPSDRPTDRSMDRSAER